jgi:hypothetical protein
MKLSEKPLEEIKPGLIVRSDTTGNFGSVDSVDYASMGKKVGLIKIIWESGTTSVNAYFDPEFGDEQPLSVVSVFDDDPRSTNVHLRYTIDEIYELNRLIEDCNTTARKDFFNLAANLTYWIIQQHKNGLKICAVDQTQFIASTLDLSKLPLVFVRSHSKSRSA